MALHIAAAAAAKTEGLTRVGRVTCHPHAFCPLEMVAHLLPALAVAAATAPLVQIQEFFMST